MASRREAILELFDSIHSTAGKVKESGNSEQTLNLANACDAMANAAQTLIRTRNHLTDDEENKE